jgi:hypothetical protein
LLDANNTAINNSLQRWFFKGTLLKKEIFLFPILSR